MLNIQSLTAFQGGDKEGMAERPYVGFLALSLASQAVCRSGFTKLDLLLALDTKESFPKGRKAFSGGAGAAENNRASVRITT